jgi:hypothetical protein
MLFAGSFIEDEYEFSERLVPNQIDPCIRRIRRSEVFKIDWGRVMNLVRRPGARLAQRPRDFPG